MFQKLIILICTVYFSKGNIFTSKQENDVMDFIGRVMSCRNVPGLTVAAVSGTRKWTKGFGIKDVHTKSPVNEETLFSIGSTGKAFTATLLGSLLDKTSYDWNTTLYDIREVNYEFVTEELTRNATLADLLAHRTGLSDSTDIAFIAGYPPEVTRDLLSRRLKFIPKVGEFRGIFHYNNFMYMLLGDVIEKLGEDRYATLMTSNLLEPIGMLSTKVSSASDDVITGNVAKPIIAKRKGGDFEEGNYEIYSIKPLEPAGTIMSNAFDMAKWMSFNLNNGMTKDGKVLIARDLYTEMFQAHSSVIWYALAFNLHNTTFPVNDINTAYGYAWFISNYRGYRRFWHSGGLFSYVSFIWLFPDENIGIFTSVNGPGHNHKVVDALRVIMYFIADILLGEELWLTPETGCTFPAPWRNESSFSSLNQPDPVDTLSLTDYVGYYGNRIFPDVRLNESDGFLMLYMNRIKGKLYPTISIDRFELELTEPWEFAIEKVVSENYTMRSSVKFARDSDNNTISFDLFLDTWITFEKGVFLFDEEDRQSPTTSGPYSPSKMSNCLYISISVHLGTLGFLWACKCSLYY